MLLVIWGVVSRLKIVHSLRVGVIFHDPCEAGFGWDGNGNRGNTRWGKQTKYCGCKSLGLHHIGLIRKGVRGIRISCKQLRGGHVILCGVLAENLMTWHASHFFLGEYAGTVGWPSSQLLEMSWYFPRSHVWCLEESQRVGGHLKSLKPTPQSLEICTSHQTIFPNSYSL